MFTSTKSYIYLIILASYLCFTSYEAFSTLAVGKSSLFPELEFEGDYWSQEDYCSQEKLVTRLLEEYKSLKDSYLENQGLNDLERACKTLKNSNPFENFSYKEKAQELIISPFYLSIASQAYLHNKILTSPDYASVYLYFLQGAYLCKKAYEGFLFQKAKSSYQIKFNNALELEKRSQEDLLGEKEELRKIRSCLSEAKKLVVKIYKDNPSRAERKRDHLQSLLNFWSSFEGPAKKMDFVKSYKEFYSSQKTIKENLRTTQNTLREFFSRWKQDGETTKLIDLHDEYSSNKRSSESPSPSSIIDSLRRES